MELRLPGDKSLTHRALLLAALAEGESRLRGLLAGADPLATRDAVEALGVPVGPIPRDGGEVRVPGVGLRGLREPTEVLDGRNSGTTVRLLLGVLAGQRLVAQLTGDETLRRRPMRRVTVPLGAMGARFRELGAPGCLPIEVQGSRLRPLAHVSPVASAQVKGAILLAGLVGGVPVSVVEPGQSRDHTERLFGGLGLPVGWGQEKEGWRVWLAEPPATVPPLDLSVPGDFSSAAFFLVLGLVSGPGAAVRVVDVGLNPTRTGLLAVLARMGARFEVERASEDQCGEPVGSVVAYGSGLRGADVGAFEIPRLIDEIPILAVAAARADGVTRITGAGELRVKESDRIAALATNLRAVGVRADELPDGLEIEGTDRPLVGGVRTYGDHRIAMAFGVLGALPGNRIEIRDPAVVDVSFPGFWEILRSLSPGRERGARGGAATRDAARPTASGHAGGAGPHKGRAVDEGDAAAPRPASRHAAPRGRGPIVTIDGPAGSGKSTTARAVARRLGFRHLDSGALYRALTFALLDAGIAPDRWPQLTPADLDPFRIVLRPGDDGFAVVLDSRVLDAELRSPQVTDRVSELSQLPVVRTWLLAHQRAAGALGWLVADGRDMGTVVFPDADLKVFLTASLEERARRRLRERGITEPGTTQLKAEMRRLEARDERDQRRTLSPLRSPEGAVFVDTTQLSFDAQVEAIVRRAQDLTPS